MRFYDLFKSECDQNAERDNPEVDEEVFEAANGARKVKFHGGSADQVGRTIQPLPTPRDSWLNGTVAATATRGWFIPTADGPVVPAPAAGAPGS